MIFNMVGGGGGSGATLVVSSPVNVSVTVSKDDKSYTKNSGSLGSTTFKGLATGTWTVTISGNGQTATKTIEITADYAITITFFSAFINITYPATSTCVVTDSSGQTVASDTNTTSSTKTFTATVNATGTYTVTATATDGSGNTKSESVEIISEGQSVSVALSYRYYLFKEGDLNENKMTYKQASTTSTTVTIGNEYIQVVRKSTTEGEVQFYSVEKHDLSKYSTLYFDVSIQDVYVFANNTTRCGVFSTEPINNAEPGKIVAVAQIDSNDSRKTYSVDLSSIGASSWPLFVGLGGSFNGKIYNIWAE